MGDHGHFTIMPQQRDRLLNAQERGSSYVKDNIVYRPDYLRVHLLRDDCVFESTPTERGVKSVLTFGQAGATRLILDCFYQGGILPMARRSQHPARLLPRQLRRRTGKLCPVVCHPPRHRRHDFHGCRK